MDGSATPTLFVIAGPNGAGKSTLYHDRIRTQTNAPFVNADEIEKQWRAAGHRESDKYAALKAAARWRDELLEAHKTFVTETVFSHQSKLDLIHRAKAPGYRVVLYHVHVSDPRFSVARVAVRVKQGLRCAGGQDSTALRAQSVLDSKVSVTSCRICAKLGL